MHAAIVALSLSLLCAEQYSLEQQRYLLSLQPMQVRLGGKPREITEVPSWDRLSVETHQKNLLFVNDRYHSFEFGDVAKYELLIVRYQKDVWILNPREEFMFENSPVVRGIPDWLFLKTDIAVMVIAVLCGCVRLALATRPALWLAAALGLPLGVYSGYLHIEARDTLCSLLVVPFLPLVVVVVAESVQRIRRRFAS